MENKLRKRAFMELKLDYDTSIIFRMLVLALDKGNRMGTIKEKE